MVNNLNPRRRVSGELKTRTTRSGRTKITNGPVYHLNIVKQLVSNYSVTVIGGSKAEKDMGNPAMFMPRMEPAELVELFQHLISHEQDNTHYVESERDPVTNNMIVDADAYKIRWLRRKKIECKLTGQPIFVKFGFRESNPKCIIVSTHPDKY